jgi:uncharacterized protein (DUF2384 family)
MTIAYQPPDKTFTALTGLPDSELTLTSIFLRGQAVPPGTPNVRELTHRLSKLLRTNQQTSASLLGLSRSTAAKDDPLNSEVLDRVHSVAMNFDRARAVFGDQAVDWFTTPHPALGNLSPLELHHTRYGERYVTEFITGMLDGTFL